MGEKTVKTILMPEPTKICTNPDCRRAGQELPLKEFGIQSIGRHGRTSRCLECLRIVGREHYRNFHKRPRKPKQQSRADVTSFNSMTDCKCPFCSKEYQRDIYWTGRLPARVYCDAHKSLVQGYESEGRAAL